uniref:Histidine ammonia-lyase n=1 Tax=Candidatus Kentrum sp. MB TaxID=2138164 RepID=A0A450XZ90_9GAMM|nr:MAG: histidine ammonia-lyase [Candidatus Kentron sp. MB]
MNKVAEDIRNILHDSYLWGKSEDRPLQDPLSYRTAAYTFGAVENSLTELRDIVRIQLNSSDDNPGVIPDVSPPSERYEERIHYVHEDDLTGAVLPTSNFSPLPWVISLQKAGIALAHASNASAQRTIKLADPHFTKLKRFLGTESTIHAYGAIQKVFSSLATENQELARPVSFNFFAIAGNIEDVATNAPMVARRIRKIIDNYYHILGIELMHAAQAIDLRLQQNPDLKLSAATRIFFDEYRRTVPFMEKDRVLTGDIEHSYHFLKGYDPKP